VSGTSNTPSYENLPHLPDSEERHAWDVWGRQDQIGSLNRLGAQQVLSACRSVEAGRVVCLTLPLNEPRPGLFPNRKAYRHSVTRSGHGRDDSLDGFFLQSSSHWDGLRHVRYRRHGYWGGRDENDLDADGSLGMAHWGAHGIFARGVLLDVVDYQRAAGEPLDPTRRFAIDGDLLEQIAEAQGVTVTPGDVIVLRTGWMEWYQRLPEERRNSLMGTVGQGENPLATPGLHGGQATAAWLWDHGVVGVAADNPAVEALPVDREAGFQHRRLIPLLGLALGEFWWLWELAKQCQELGRHHFLLAAAPLQLPGGVGSPANAYAIL
jgi:kynurenine formamidase